MAIIQENEEHTFQDSNSIILERLELVEKLFAEVDYSLEQTKIELLMQNMRSEIISDQLQAMKEMKTGDNLPSRDKAWRERLLFRKPGIVSDSVWRGNVDKCYNIISKDIEKHIAHSSYLGSTCDPERRLTEHMKKTPGVSMNILYHTTSVQKAADMESRLLSKFRITRNTSLHSHGLLWGKPSYFVYMLVEKGLRKGFRL